jgi:hypothetical protein
MKKGHRVPQTEKAMAHFASSFFFGAYFRSGLGEGVRRRRCTGEKKPSESWAFFRCEPNY